MGERNKETKKHPNTHTEGEWLERTNRIPWCGPATPCGRAAAANDAAVADPPVVSRDGRCCCHNVNSFEKKALKKVRLTLIKRAVLKIIFLLAMSLSCVLIPSFVSRSLWFLLLPCCCEEDLRRLRTVGPELIDCDRCTSTHDQYFEVVRTLYVLVLRRSSTPAL